MTVCLGGAEVGPRTCPECGRLVHVLYPRGNDHRMVCIKCCNEDFTRRYDATERGNV